MPTYTLLSSAKDNDPKLVKIVKSLLNASNLNPRDPLVVDENADKKLFARAYQFSTLKGLEDAYGFNDQANAHGFISTRAIVYLAKTYAYTLRLPNVEPSWLGKYFRACISSYLAPFNIDMFLSMYRENFKILLPAGAGWIDDLRRFIGFLINDPGIKDRRWASYMLATAIHENRALADQWKATWRPVGESDSSKQWYGGLDTVVDWSGKPLDANGNRIAPVTDPDELKKTANNLVTIGRSKYPKDKVIQRLYDGRGYSQITHQENYRAMDEALGLNGALHLNPDMAAGDAALAYKILSHGMRVGGFRTQGV